jgi:DNA-binding transcriptional regulator YiaG
MAKPKQLTGAELRASRDLLRLSQSQLALVLGVPRGTIASWESGRGVVPLALTRPLDKAVRLSSSQWKLLSEALSEAPAAVGERWS